MHVGEGHGGGIAWRPPAENEERRQGEEEPPTRGPCVGEALHKWHLPGVWSSRATKAEDRLTLRQPVLY